MLLVHSPDSSSGFGNANLNGSGLSEGLGEVKVVSELAGVGNDVDGPHLEVEGSEGSQTIRSSQSSISARSFTDERSGITQCCPSAAIEFCCRSKLVSAKRQKIVIQALGWEGT